MFLHEGDEFRLGQEVRGAGLLLHQLDLVHCKRVPALADGHGLLQRDALPRHHCSVPWEEELHFNLPSLLCCDH